jgi:hypothetical protein
VLRTCHMGSLGSLSACDTHARTHARTHASPPPHAGVVDVCLIPEVPFELDPLLAFVKDILETKEYCVICVAEGARPDPLPARPRPPSRPGCLSG